MKKAINPAVFEGVVSELKKVSWPSRKEALQLTALVVILSLLIGAYIGGLDFIFTNILSLALNLKK